MDSLRAHVYIEGRVQGVFYREWTKAKAEDLGLTGWVKNLEDGKVEAVFEGEKKKLEEMLAECKKGSRLSKVKHIDIIWETATREFSGFSVL
jgi:acylphosphatase